MTSKKLAAFLFIQLCISALTAQTESAYKEKFAALVAKKDTLEQRRLLVDWQTKRAGDAELYIAYFNFYVRKSENHMLVLGQEPGRREALAIQSKDTNDKKPLAFLYSNESYDPLLLSEGFDWINRGITAYPNRLDMRFGKIYMFGRLEAYDAFTKEIISAVKYSAVNNNDWTWSEGKKTGNPKEFFLDGIQSYQLQLFNTEKDTLLENMKQIAEAVLAIYPNHVESLSNLAIVYILTEKYNKALEYLLRAEKINERDVIVLGNIAETYKRKKENAKAREYYEKCIKYGDAETKKACEEAIKELRK